MRVGLRIKVTQELDFFPHFQLKPGMTGTVASVEQCLVWVRMDETIPGCEHWDNEVCFSLLQNDGHHYNLQDSCVPLTD